MASLSPSASDRLAELVRSIPVDRARFGLQRKISAFRGSIAKGWDQAVPQAKRGIAAVPAIGRNKESKADRSFTDKQIRVATAVAAGVLAVAGVALAVTSDRTAAPAAIPVELSPAVVISNLSDGRDGRPFAMAGGEPLFPLPAATLASFKDKPIEMQGVAVQSVVPGVGFWIGEDTTQQVFVVMRPATTPEETVLLQPELASGEVINLSGYMRLLPDMATAIGVSDPTQAAQLDKQQYRVEANSVRK